MTNQFQREISLAAMAGWVSLVWCTKPERWPAFAAWAEAHQGVTWTEEDRKSMLEAGRFLYRLAEAWGA